MRWLSHFLSWWDQQTHPFQRINTWWNVLPSSMKRHGLPWRNLYVGLSLWAFASMSKAQFLGPRTLKTCSVPNFLIITGTKTKSWCSRYSTRFGNEMKLHWIPSPTLPDLPGSTTNHTIYPTWERHARCHTLARWSDHPPLHSFDVDLRWGRRGWDMVPSCGAPPPCQVLSRSTNLRRYLGWNSKPAPQILVWLSNRHCLDWVGVLPRQISDWLVVTAWFCIMFMPIDHESWSKLNHILGIAQPPARCRCFTSHLVRFSWGLDFIDSSRHRLPPAAANAAGRHASRVKESPPAWLKDGCSKPFNDGPLLATNRPTVPATYRTYADGII